MKVINTWSRYDDSNYTSNGDSKWYRVDSLFGSDRVIESFKVLYGNIGFLVSGTVGVYLKADGFKDFMDKMLSKESTNQEFPEYYQYIGYSDNFTIDKIYKIIHKDTLNVSKNFVDDHGRLNGHGSNNHKCFKPSTKEAFELQEAKNNKPNPIKEESNPTEMYIVKEEDLIGDIKGFPIEVVQKMIERQVEQGNKADVKIFQNLHISPVEYGGFEWNKSIEGAPFWNDVIGNKKIPHILQKIP